MENNNIPGNENLQVEQPIEILDDNTNNKKEKKPKKKKVIIITIILVLIIAGVAAYFLIFEKNETKKVVSDNKEVKSEYKMTGNDLQDFDLSFLKIENDEKNIVYSPLSIKYSLAMLKEGASGTSESQLEAVIGDYQSNKYVNSENMSFANAIFISNNFKEAIKKDYISTLQEKYNAEAIFDDFKTPDNINKWVSDNTFNLINNLVDDVTGKQFYLINALAIDMNWKNIIQEAAGSKIDSLGYYSVFYTHEKVNGMQYQETILPIYDEIYPVIKFSEKTQNSKAVEFGASINKYDIVKELGEENIRELITKEYNEYLTSDAAKYEMDPTPTAEFVERFIEELNENYKHFKTSTDLSYYVDDSVKVFAKDLREYDGTTLEYVGIMPTDKSLKEYITSSTASSLNETLNKLKEVKYENFEEGKVYRIKGGVPLFKYDYQLELTDDLKQLGITDIFDPEKADLTNLSKAQGTIISDTIHKADIEFSNEGIKAAAATATGGLGSTRGGFEHLFEVPFEDIDLTFDNPYLYLIRDKKTKEVWFVGAVYNPIANENISEYNIINK